MCTAQGTICLYFVSSIKIDICCTYMQRTTSFIHSCAQAVERFLWWLGAQAIVDITLVTVE